MIQTTSFGFFFGSIDLINLCPKYTVFATTGLIGAGLGIAVLFGALILYMDDNNNIIPEGLIKYLGLVMYHSNKSQKDRHTVNMHYKSFRAGSLNKNEDGYVFDSFDPQAVNLRRLFPGHSLQWIKVNHASTPQDYLAVRVSVGSASNEYKWMKAVFKEEIKMLTNYRPVKTQVLGDLSLVRVQVIDDTRIYVSRPEADGTAE